MTLRPIPREPRRGERLTARDLGAIARAARPPIGQRQTGRQAGWTREQRMQVSEVAGDYLTCYLYADDGTVGTETVVVAKPYLLRNSITQRDDIDYEYTDIDARTADNGTSTEDQVVVPGYVVGDDIVARGPVLGGTGVEIDEVAVIWLDSNNDGRAWAKATG